MDVIDILSQIAYLSNGLNVTPKKEECGIYLNFLNTVHMDLYRHTAKFNPDVCFYKNDYVPIDSDTGRIKKADFSLNTNNVGYIYNSKGILLERKLLSELIAIDPALKKKCELGKSEYWSIEEGEILIYPKEQKEALHLNPYCSIWAKPFPKKLTYDTKEQDIPYPSIYHQVLVDGTIYYVFQNETGMRNQTELALANERWQKGKQELLWYFLNTEGVKTMINDQKPAE